MLDIANHSFYPHRLATRRWSTHWEVILGWGKQWTTKWDTSLTAPPDLPPAGPPPCPRPRPPSPWWPQSWGTSLLSTPLLLFTFSWLPFNKFWQFRESWNVTELLDPGQCVYYYTLHPHISVPAPSVTIVNALHSTYWCIHREFWWWIGVDKEVNIYFLFLINIYNDIYTTLLDNHWKWFIRMCFLGINWAFYVSSITPFYTSIHQQWPQDIKDVLRWVDHNGLFRYLCYTINHPLPPWIL